VAAGHEIVGAPESSPPKLPPPLLLEPPPSSEVGLPPFDFDEQPEPDARAMSPRATKKINALVCRFPMARRSKDGSVPRRRSFVHARRALRRRKITERPLGSVE
jgi:hypothetical protein